jgi:hypothetical protein
VMCRWDPVTEVLRVGVVRPHRNLCHPGVLVERQTVVTKRESKMNSLVTNPRAAFPALAAWLDNSWPFSGTNAMRIEESTQDGRYLVRAELPGFVTGGSSS